MKEELRALRKSFQMGVFERVVEVLKQVEVQQPQQQQQPAPFASTTPSLSSTEQPTPSSAARNSSPSRLSLLPIPETGDSGTYSPSQIISILSLAVSAIECTRCQLIDTFARQLSHTCRFGNRPSFSADGYAVSPSLVLEVLRLVTLAGKPATVSAEEMDNLGCAFTCIGSRCRDPSQATAVPWYEMLRHLY